MALTPIPYTDNWSGTFGSQVIPTEANAPTAAKVNPPVIASAVLSTPGLVTVVATRAGVGKVDWGDGTPLGVMAAGGGNLTHTYTRNGNFGIKIYTDADPSVFATTRVTVNNVPKPSSEQIFSVTMTELVAAFTVANGVAPFDIDFGDGSIGRSFGINFSHTYAAPGDYNVQLRDSGGWRPSVVATAANAAPLGPTPPEPDMTEPPAPAPTAKSTKA